MSIQSGINALVGAVVGTAALKGKATMKPANVTQPTAGPTTEVAKQQKGVKQEEIVAANQTKLNSNPGYSKLPANSQGMLNTPMQFSTYSEPAQQSSLMNMAQEVQGRYNQREAFRSRMKASRKTIGGKN